MILTLNEKDAAALTLHLSIMKKSFRNIVKRRCKSDKAFLIDSYSFILEEVKNALEELQTSNKYDIHLNIKDLEVLKAFLDAYLDRIDKELELKSYSKSDLVEHVLILRDINERLKKVGEAYA